MRDRAGAHALRRRLDAGTHQREMRIDLVLVERGQALAGGEQGPGIEQWAACGRKHSDKMHGRSMPVLHRSSCFTHVMLWLAGRLRA
jgi:hypothetical protein